MTEEKYVSNTFYCYNTETEQYELIIGEYDEHTDIEKFYEKQLISEQIDLSKVWTLKKEYEGGYNEQDFEIITVYKKDKEGNLIWQDGKNVFDYYACKLKESGEIYYINKNTSTIETGYNPYDIYKDEYENYVIL
jgi:hypothetical protein